MSELNTNKELARKLNTTSRQVSKSRKRGWITTNDVLDNETGDVISSGVKKSYTAPSPIKI